MSGVFEKEPLVEQPQVWGDPTCPEAYRYFYCPKCKAQHKYGHLKDGIDCWRCFYWFCPATDSYRREVDRISRLHPSEQNKAYKNIYGMSKAKWEASQLLKQQKQEEKRLRDLRHSTWHYKIRHNIVLAIKRLLRVD